MGGREFEAKDGSAQGRLNNSNAPIREVNSGECANVRDVNDRHGTGNNAFRCQWKEEMRRHAKWVPSGSLDLDISRCRRV